jgi:hypothetical protein
MIFNARSPNEVLSRAHHDRVIFGTGERLEAVLPDYDDLVEATAQRDGAAALEIREGPYGPGEKSRKRRFRWRQSRCPAAKLERL